MDHEDSQPAIPPGPSDETFLAYRCVCGELTRLDPRSPRCACCDRHYDYQSLRSAMAATAILYTDETGQATTEIAATQAEDDTLVGRRLGHFLILNRLGGGGMGSVYRALDESLQRYVALKVIHTPHPAADDLGLQGAFQEARAQARVNHPNVAHIYYVGSDADVPFLAMELVGERTLADRMRDGPLPFQEVILFGLQIAEALRHAAKYDIVHGDVKPNNVLLVDETTAKLSDFGLARRLSLAAGAVPAAGTPEFVAPEVTTGQPADHRSDMYSLGVTLFKMTFGRPPYTPSSHELVETLRMHRDAEVEFPESWPADLPQSWRSVLARLLEKNPAKRYQEFDVLIRELKKHRPVTLPNASPLLRGLAWVFDSLLLSIPLGVAAVVFSIEVLQFFILRQFVAQAAITFGFCYLQALWGTTPGKRLFQIRIVDQFGLRPAKWILGARASLQFLWAWSVVASGLLTLIRLPFLATLVVAAVWLFLAVEMLLVLFSKGRSVHDRVFKTRVVLDAAPAGEP